MRRLHPLRIFTFCPSQPDLYTSRCTYKGTGDLFLPSLCCYPRPASQHLYLGDGESPRPIPCFRPCVSEEARPPEQHAHRSPRTADPRGHVMVSYGLYISLELCPAFPVTRKPSRPKAPQLFSSSGGFRDLTLAWLERSLLASACTLINNEKHLLYVCMSHFDM